ncbi:hypothetical protein [Dokdonia sp.]|uniref:hypothetical protein n=1 Tax=Dokdonia sp. TaxID=2024995 RepID=UPI00326362CB
MKKDVITGAIVGLIANTIGATLYALFLASKYGITLLEVLQNATDDGYFGKIVTLGAVLNLVAFFIFIKKKQDYKARGVLMITVLIAVAIMVRKFL